MKVKLKNADQLDGYFIRLRTKLTLTPKRLKLFSLFKKLLRYNVEYLPDVQAAKLYEFEESLEQRALETAKCRIMLPESLRVAYSKASDELLMQLQQVKNYFEGDDSCFKLKKNKIEDVVKQLKINCCYDKIMEKIERTKRAVQHECRKSIGNDNVNDNPVKTYFNFN